MQSKWHIPPPVPATRTPMLVVEEAARIPTPVQIQEQTKEAGLVGHLERNSMPPLLPLVPALTVTSTVRRRRQDQAERLVPTIRLTTRVGCTRGVARAARRCTATPAHHTARPAPWRPLPRRAEVIVAFCKR